MATYLEEHPPARQQYIAPRRSEPSGGIVVHTAENLFDVSPPDNGGEAVAHFIANRTDAAGSYHSLVDSDSIVRVMPYEWEAFGEGTGGNRWALHLSFACHATDWATMPEAWRTGALANGAQEAANMARWVNAVTGLVVPALHIPAFDYRAQRPGFVYHAQLDPSRRSDPGASFPMTDFLNQYAIIMSQEPIVPPSRIAIVAEAQQVLFDAGFYTGPLDGDPSPLFLTGVHGIKNDRLAQMARVEALEAELARRPTSGALSAAITLVKVELQKVLDELNLQGL
jgi:hypothetical protein